MSIKQVDLALTTAGQTLKAKIEAGLGNVALTITRIVTASGVSDDPLNLADVVDLKQEFSVTGRKTTGVRTTIEAILTNAELTEGYPLTQIGFYALDPDEGEILYRISQFSSPNYVPASTERGWTYKPSFNFITGNAECVNVTLETGTASKDEVTELTQRVAALEEKITASNPDLSLTPEDIEALFEGINIGSNGEISGVISASGVTREYVDERDAQTLHAAQEYADNSSGNIGEITSSDIGGLFADANKNS